MYRYDTVELGSNKLLMRTNRITGNSQITFGSGDKTKAKILPSEELVKVTGTASVGYANTFTCDLYNGSNWTIAKVIFRLDIFEVGGELRWTREYQHDIDVRPLTSKSFIKSISQAENYGNFKWNIIEVYGYKP